MPAGLLYWKDSLEDTGLCCEASTAVMCFIIVFGLITVPGYSHMFGFVFMQEIAVLTGTTKGSFFNSSLVLVSTQMFLPFVLLTPHNVHSPLTFLIFLLDMLELDLSQSRFMKIEHVFWILQSFLVTFKSTSACKCDFSGPVNSSTSVDCEAQVSEW